MVVDEIDLEHQKIWLTEYEDGEVKSDPYMELLDYDGTLVLSGKQSQIWKTEQGYGKVAYYDLEGNEVLGSSAYILNFGAENPEDMTIWRSDIRAYAQLFDANGNLMEEQEITNDSYSHIRAKEIYPYVRDAQQEQSEEPVKIENGDILAAFSENIPLEIEVSSQDSLIFVYAFGDWDEETWARESWVAVYQVVDSQD